MQAIQAREPTEQPRFTARDEADLRWFFGEGQSEFARSPTGFMLERAKALSTTSEGVPVLSIPQYRVKVWEYRQHGCRGQRVGWSSDDADEPTELFDAASRDLLRRAAAPFVEMFDPEADAWFTSGHQPGTAGMPSDWAMQRLGRVSRRLRTVRGRLYTALAAYHGLAANRWEGHILGRVIVLYGLTSAGDTILFRRCERLGSEEDAGSSPAERVSAEHQVQQQKPDIERRRLFEAAARQALELRAMANAAYAGSAQ